MLPKFFGIGKVAEQGTVLALIEGMALCDDNIGEDDQDNVVEAIMRDWEEVLLRRFEIYKRKGQRGKFGVESLEC